MEAKNEKIIGIAWYRREDYPAVLETMVDAHLLPRNYDAWLALASQVVKIEELNGSRIVKANIPPHDFLAWCRTSQLMPDVKARTRWVNQAISGAGP